MSSVANRASSVNKMGCTRPDPTTDGAVHVPARVVITVAAGPREGKEANCSSESFWPGSHNRSHLYWLSQPCGVYRGWSGSNSGRTTQISSRLEPIHTSADISTDKPRPSGGNDLLRGSRDYSRRNRAVSNQVSPHIAVKLTSNRNGTASISHSFTVATRTSLSGPPTAVDQR
jgi:hypothetical protein